MQHTLIALVENQPGVLTRIASLFQRRSFNIDSLTVGRTDNPAISRITIVIDAKNNNAERLTTYLDNLVNTICVEDVTESAIVSRDLAMVKVNVTPTNRSEVIQLVEVFRARIIDVANDSLLIEITGSEDKIEGFIGVLKPFGIIEMVRSGVIAMRRGPDSLGDNAAFIQTNNYGNGNIKESG